MFCGNFFGKITASDSEASARRGAGTLDAHLYALGLCGTGVGASWVGVSDDEAGMQDDTGH